VRRVALLCGVVSPILWIGLIAFGDIVRPDVDAVTGFISELGERGSATELIMRWAGFGVTGLLYVCFAAALPSAAGTGRWRILLVALFVAVDGIGRVGAAVYPCDPGCQGTSRDQQLHRLFATIAFCSGILAALADGVLFRRGFAAAMGLSAMIFLLLMTWSDNPLDAHGLFERLATGALSLWMLVFATRMRRWPNPRRDPLARR
jgi:hypothetical membrane protein